MKKNNHAITRTLATSLSLGLISPSLADVKTIDKGPYTIKIEEESNFGDRDYKYNFWVLKNGKELIKRESKSSINGWAVKEESLHYNQEKDTLWVIYEQSLDGLDPREIHIAKIKNGIVEEAVGSYDPMARASSLQMIKTPEGWNKLEVEQLLKQAVGEGDGGEITGPYSNSQSTTAPKTTPSQTSNPVEQPKQALPTTPKKKISQEPKSNATEKSGHSMEW